MAESSEPSYIDYEAFLSPTFSAPAFANSLVLSTNNASDSPLDLSTPLSRVLFDVQEIDTHIDGLSNRSALPILTHTRGQDAASARILREVDAQVAGLSEGYRRLEKEVLERYEAAEEVRRTSERLWATVRLGRAVARCLQLGRQLELQLTEIGLINLALPMTTTTTTTTTALSNSVRKEDHRAMVRAAGTLLALRALFQASGPREEGEGLARIRVATTLRNEVIAPAERAVIQRAQQIIREFSMSSLSSVATGSSAVSGSASTTKTSATTTFSQTEATKARTISALSTLYLLSTAPIPTTTSTVTAPSSSNNSNGGSSTRHARKGSVTFEPDLLISALQEYLRTALTSSLASLARSLGTLPTLDRTLLEVSARCQNIVALELLLETTRPPEHPYLPSASSELHTNSTTNSSHGIFSPAPTAPSMKSATSPLPSSPAAASSSSALSSPLAAHHHHHHQIAAAAASNNFLQPLLHSLETGSLPSYFWRSLASGLAARVQELVARGGVSARTLRSNREGVRDAIRECVVRGSRPPAGAAAAAAAARSSSAANSGNNNSSTAGAEASASSVAGGGAGSAGSSGWEREVAVMVGSVIGNLGR